MTALEPDYNTLPPELADALQLQWAIYQANCLKQQVGQPTHSDFISSLTRVWSSSEFAAQTCVQHPQLVVDLFESGDMLREYPTGEMAERAALALFGVQSEIELMHALRLFRRREMLRIAWRNIAGWANLNFTSKDLSELADACINSALQPLSRWLIEAMGQPRDRFGNSAGLLVVAVGKLGAQELNFSSDVDLLFVYPHDGEFEDSDKTFQQYYVRLGQQLVKVLSTFTADGFVFRVDMRLRPYGSSGALVTSFAQLRDYYQTQGRDWERYAMIKARVISGVKKHRLQLASIIRNFVYQQYLDFSMMESLRLLQQKISREVRCKDLHDNVKRGPGGIREIEFIGQTYKLIRGGWQVRLQLRHTIRTILVLREMRLITADFADRLIVAYRFLRNIENRLQMQNDQQTHSLPKTHVAQQQLVIALNKESWPLLQQEIKQHMQFVHKAFEELIAKPQLQFENEKIQARKKPMEQVWLNKVNVDKAGMLLTKCNYQSHDKILYLLQHLRQSKASQYLPIELKQHFDAIVPHLLVLVSQEDNPDQTLSRIVDVLESVLSHPVYLALLYEHPGAMGQLVSLCAVSPWIAEQIARYPALLDELLRPSTLYAPPSLADLKQLLQEQLISIAEDNVEEQVHALQSFKQIHMLRVAAADITGVLSLMKVSDYLTDLATVVVDQVLTIVWRTMVQRYGFPSLHQTEISFGVLAYGKLGGIELGYSSDLDLVFVHDNIPADNMTDGEHAISSEQFYTRMGQQILTLLGGQTPAGRLYEVDMRLRPSGNSGLLVPSMSAFESYQQQQAWPWEHQALVRARMIAGSSALKEKFNSVREHILSQSRDEIELQAEVRQMRQRMRDAVKQHRPEQFDIKQCIGGIADIEFLVQFVVLYWSAEYPALMEWPDNIRILENMGIAGIIHVDEVRDLQKIYRDYRDTVHRLSLQNQPAWIDESEFVEQRALVTDIFQRLIG